MPAGMEGKKFYTPADNPKEREIGQRIEKYWKGKY